MRMKNRAFRLWRENGRNLKKTRDQVFEEYGIKVEVSTIMRWRDQYDWEAKYLLVENQVKKLLRSSSDPIIREMALDDAMTMRFLGILVKLVEDSLGPRRHRQQFMPRNSAELMKMIEFVTREQARILGAEEQRKEAGVPSHVTFNDNRKIVLRDKLAMLPPAQKRIALDTLRNAYTQEELQTVREQAFKEDPEEGVVDVG